MGRKAGPKNDLAIVLILAAKSTFIPKYPYYLCPTKTEYSMATTASKESTRKYWLYFLISLVIFLLMLIFMNQWFWVAMPFMLTFLVMALGYM